MEGSGGERERRREEAATITPFLKYALSIMNGLRSEILARERDTGLDYGRRALYAKERGNFVDKDTD